MNSKRLAFTVFILCLFIFITAAYCAESVKVAKEKSPNTESAGAGRPEDGGSDIVLLMDSSGSMKKTDPRNYRKDSARLFISLLGADDSVGVVSFGDTAKTLIPLTQNSAGNRNAFIKAIGRITSKELSTDITGAVKKGVEELGASKRQNRVLIIMSDGKLALGDAEKEKSSLEELNTLLPEIRKAGIKLYSIAFSDLSDRKLLEEMAEKTGGFFRYAAADRDIHLMFASIFEKIKSPDSVALEGDSFSVDKDVREAVLLITKQPGTATVLVDPSGKKVAQGKSDPNIQWYNSGVFDMITIKEPMTGRWKIRLSSQEGNRIFVLTDLKLRTSFTGNSVKEGSRPVIEAWLEKDGKRISDKDVLSQMEFSAHVISPDGKNLRIPLAGKDGADTGIYSAAINIDQAGDYTVRLSAGGKTFNRTKDILFKSEAPPPAPSVPAQPKQAVKTEPAQSGIDWMTTSLVLGIVTALLIVLAGYFYYSARRYRKLYFSLSGETAVAGDEHAARQDADSAYGLPVPESGETAEAIVTPTTVVNEEAIEQVSDESPAEEEIEKTGADSARMEKLLGIIEFQKVKIAELMFVKDIFENARGRLSALQARNRLMQDKVKSIAGSFGINDEIKEPMAALEDDTSELVSYILVFEKEEKRLAEKFLQWEEDLNKLMEGEEYTPARGAADSADADGRIAELEERLKEAQDQIMSKERRMQALEKQYEDIEKEYMILYHAAQKQQQQPKG